jgi:Ni,Fe-hydrogenase III component G
MTAKSARCGHHENQLNSTDSFVYMLRWSKSRPGYWIWVLFAVMTGTLLARVVLGLGSLLF